MSYSIIIPIYNELPSISILLRKVENYRMNNLNEIIIIDDGSNDGTENILKECSFIILLTLEKNYGKGTAIQIGLKKASKEKVVIFDGDLELNPKIIKKLMILNKERNIECVFGSRYKSISPFTSLWDFGNFIFTSIFNIIHNSNHTDSLCCAKAFYRDKLDLEKLQSKDFSIDVELAGYLIKNNEVKTIYIDYKRRTRHEGKKLNFMDGWSILRRILINY